MEVDEAGWWDGMKTFNDGSRCQLLKRTRPPSVRRVQPRWQGRVAPLTSLHDLLFTLLDDAYPFRRSLRVSACDGDFEFSLNDRDELEVAERCDADEAVEVLDRLL